MNGLRIFSGNSNQPLAQSVCSFFDLPLGKATVSTFSDGEIQLEIQENAPNRKVYTITQKGRQVFLESLKSPFGIQGVKNVF